MTANATNPGFVPDADLLPPPRIQPLRALHAVRRLMADKDDTLQVFEIMEALNGKAALRGYLRLLRSRTGARMAYDAEELAEVLGNPEVMARCAPGTVGAEYRNFMESEHLSAIGLIAESEKAAGTRTSEPHPVEWYGRRIRDSHDLWHTLTGYGRDPLGELCLVAFSFAQTREPGWAAIALGGMLDSLRFHGWPHVLKAVWRAWSDGRRAAWLPGEDMAVVLGEPLECARCRLRIPFPAAYRGIPPAIRAGLFVG